MICSQPGLHAEAKRLVARFEAALAPAGEDGVKAILGKLFAIYPQADRSAPEWAAWWEAYVEDLEMLPEWALSAGAKAYRRLPGSQFFPKPGEIRALAGAAAANAVKSAARIRMAARRDVVSVGVPLESLERRQAVADEIRRSLGMRTVPKEASI